MTLFFMCLNIYQFITVFLFIYWLGYQNSLRPIWWEAVTVVFRRFVTLELSQALCPSYLRTLPRSSGHVTHQKNTTLLELFSCDILTSPDGLLKILNRMYPAVHYLNNHINYLWFLCFFMTPSDHLVIISKLLFKIFFYSTFYNNIYFL